MRTDDCTQWAATAAAAWAEQRERRAPSNTPMHWVLSASAQRTKEAGRASCKVPTLPARCCWQGFDRFRNFQVMCTINYQQLSY